ncbi:LytR family transcriptional regulator [Evansella tamaricis]|uniref:LytR family transcriptional regulator n=1 Tax=Evansella tamaricis TaxID=2069301 RepID=UPI001FE3E908|nr:LytR family transcriptional regulator [Evansella tamaricis]
MKLFDTLPKSIKKTIRYINQDIHSLEKLSLIEKELLDHLQRRKEQLEMGSLNRAGSTRGQSEVIRERRYSV